MNTSWVDTDLRGDFLPAPIEVDELRWPVRRCAEHEYVGVPPCPVPRCANGHDRQIYVMYRVAGFGSAEKAEGSGHDEITLGEERIFLRHRNHPHQDKADGYTWRELVDKL